MIEKYLKFCIDLIVKNLFIVSSLFFTTLALSISGIYWGWIDDVFYANNFQCLTNSVPLYDPDYFIGLSYVIIFLYNNFPSISWLGYFLFCLLALVYFLTLIVLNYTIKKHSQNNKLNLLISFFIAGIFHYYFFRLNFTAISCLAVATGLVYTQISLKKHHKLIGFSLSFIGLLIRWQTGIILYLLYFIYLSIIYIESKDRFAKIKPSLYFLPITFILFFSVKLNVKNSDVMNLYKTTPFEFLIQDAYYKPESKNISYSESLIRDAVIFWNTQDREIINRDWYSYMLKSSLSSFGQIKETLINKVKFALSSSIKYSKEQNSMNWHYKLFLYLIPLILVFYLSINNKSNGYKYHYIFILIGFLLISAIAVLIKIEDRLLFPYLFFIYLLSIIYYENNQDNIYKKLLKSKAFNIFLLGFSTYLFLNTYNQSKILKQDLVTKSKFIEEINEFNGKIFLLDGFSPYLFQTSPFKNVSLNKNNSYLLTLHYGRNNFYSIQNSFPNCYNLSYIETFKCIESKKENVIFIYADFNIDFLKKWNSNFYNLNSDFKKIKPHSLLSNFNNKLLFNDVDIDYYIIE